MQVDRHSSSWSCRTGCRVAQWTASAADDEPVCVVCGNDDPDSVSDMQRCDGGCSRWFCIEGGCASALGIRYDKRLSSGDLICSVRCQTKPRVDPPLSLSCGPGLPGQEAVHKRPGGRCLPTPLPDGPRMASPNPLKVHIGTVKPEAKSSFAAAFVLPITRDGRALLTREKRGKETKYGMLGGKARPDETDFKCMSREAEEESGATLTQITIARIAEGRGILDGAKAYYENAESYAIKHDLVVPADLDVDTRFEPSKVASMRSTGRSTIDKKAKKAKKARAKSDTEHVGLEFVPVSDLHDWEWRSKNMHHAPSVLAARLLKLGAGQY